MARKNRKMQRLRVVSPDCAGIDIGKDRHFVAVDPARSSEPVRAFDSFTRDLQAMAEWLSSCEREDGGDGIDLGLLDPGLRGPGARRLRGAPGAAPDDEADCRSQERRARLPVDLAAAVLRAAAGRLPSRRCGLPAALLCAPDEAPDRGPHALRAAHAEGADRDECPAGLGASRTSRARAA